MSIFQINKLNSLSDFIVPDQSTLTAATGNPIIGTCVIGTEADAAAKLAINQQEFMAAMADRFQIQLVTKDFNGNTVWGTVDLTNAPANGNYMVFDHTTGSYTEYSTLTAAETANAGLQQKLLSDNGMAAYITLTTLPTVPLKSKPQPTTSGTTVV